VIASPPTCHSSLTAHRPRRRGLLQDLSQVCGDVSNQQHHFRRQGRLEWIEKYKIKWESCYRLRPYVADHWGTCLTCITVCPYSKPNTWWHGLALRVLRTTPVALRPAVVWSLKWLDDTFWGKIPRKRVRWLGYDSGIKPGEKACTIPGCTHRTATVARARARASRSRSRRHIAVVALTSGTTFP